MSRTAAKPPFPLAPLRLVERWTAAALVAVILGLMSAQVIARYLFHAPIPWSEEVACFAFVWLTFVAGALVAGEERHLTVDVIAPFLGNRGRLIVECVTSAAVVLCCVLMVIGSIPFVARLKNIASPSAGIPRRWWYLAAAVGLSLIALHAVVNATSALRRGSTTWGDDVSQRPPMKEDLP